MTEVGTFVLKDEQGNYVGGNSIYYDKETKEFIYSYSRFLTNGFYTYPSQEKAEKELENLKEVAKQARFNRKFYVEKIDISKIIREESNFNIPKYPFIQQEIVKKGRAVVA